MRRREAGRRRDAPRIHGRVRRADVLSSGCGTTKETRALGPQRGTVMRMQLLIPAIAMLAVLGARGAGAAGSDGAPASDGLKPGDVLDQKSAQRAEGLLPPEILKHYQHNEYVNPISDWPANVYNWPEDFQAGSKQNTGRYTTGKLGEILEKASGKQPAYIIGFPFPEIDPADPAAAVKILWNFYYRTYYFGNLRAESQLNMMSPGSLERRLDVDVSFMYYDGVPEQERVKNNPQNFLYQQPERPAGHRVTQLAVSRPPEARFLVGLRPGAASRPRGEPRQPVRRLSRLRHEPGRWSLLRRQAGGLRLEAEGRGRPAAARRSDESPGQVGEQLAGERWLARGLAGRPQIPRVHGSPVARRVLGADRRRARQAPLLRDRGHAPRQVLPVREDRALPRQDQLPGRVEPQVRLERRAAQHREGDGLEPAHRDSTERQ